MRISVDPELCAGHAVCQARAPSSSTSRKDGRVGAMLITAVAPT